MKLSRRQHAILDLLQAAQALEQAEQAVEEIGDYGSRLRMSEAHDVFLTAQSKASRYLEGQGEIAEVLSIGMIFLNVFND